MSSLPKHFIIIVDGQYVTGPETEHDEVRPAQVGEKPATFELDGKHLKSGDWVLGCGKLQGHAGAPSLSVCWFKKGHTEELYPVYVKEGNNGPQLRFASSTDDEEGRPLAVLNNILLCYVLDNSEPDSTVQIVPSED